MPALRPVHYSVLVKVFERDRFTFSRQSGDHLIYTEAGNYSNPVVIRPLLSPRTMRFPYSSSKFCSAPRE